MAYHEGVKARVTDVSIYYSQGPVQHLDGHEVVFVGVVACTWVGGWVGGWVGDRKVEEDETV